MTLSWRNLHSNVKEIILSSYKPFNQIAKISTSASLTKRKPLCGSQQTGKFLMRWHYQTTLPDSWETCMQVKKQQLKLDMEKQTGSKLGKEYVKAVYCHPAYLTYMQNISCKMPGCMKHKLESRLLREISVRYIPWDICVLSHSVVSDSLRTNGLYIAY